MRKQLLLLYICSQLMSSTSAMQENISITPSSQKYAGIIFEHIRFFLSILINNDETQEQIKEILERREHHITLYL